jgi:ankyrin repeat protein
MKFFLLLVFIVQALPVQAETIVFGNGSTISGRVGSLKDNIIQFHSNGYFTYYLNTIRDVTVDDEANAEEKIKQERAIKRLHQVIDREKFLKSDLTRQVNTLLLNRQFRQLDALAETLLREKQRFPSGRMKEAVFYYGVDRDLKKANAEYFRKRMLLIDEWINATGSETAHIASMHLAIGYAWAYRGGGYSNTVTKENSKKFISILDTALKKGEHLRYSGTKNISVYAKLISIYKTRRGNNDYIQKLAIEGARIEPYYYGLHKSTITALLPKWGGSREDVKTYIQRTSEKYGRKTDKKDMYFRLVQDVFEKAKEKNFPFYQFNWRRVKDSFNAYVNLYPVTEKHYHSMAKMAGAFNDRAAVTEYLSFTSQQWNHFAKSIWKRKTTLNQFVEWANEEESPEFTKMLVNFLSDTLLLDIDETLKIYILSGGNLDEKDAYGNTLLHYAVTSNNSRYVYTLLKAGANPATQDRYGRNALYIAASLGNKSTIDTMLSTGVDVSALSSSKRTVAHAAADKGFTHLLEKFIALDSGLLNSVSSHGKTPLHRAASNGYSGTVEYLLQHPDIEADVQDKRGYTALHYASSKNHLATVKILADHGVNTALLTKKYQYSALNFAEEYQFNELAIYLKSVGATINTHVISQVDRDRAVELYDEAGAFFKPGQHEKAISLMEEAIAVNPNYALAHHGMAILYLYYAKDYALAETFIMQAFKLNAKDAESHYTAGRIYYAMGDIAKSKPFFQKYVKMSPDTYNTQDLKNNYAHLLKDTVGASTTMSKHSSFINSLRSAIQQYKTFLLAGCSIALLLLLLIRRRQSKKQSV